MKKNFWIFALTAASLVIVAGFTYRDIQPSEEIPEDVAAVLNNSCFGCHNSEGRNEDAKEAVEFDKWDSLNVVHKISTLSEINEVLEEGTMPPAMMLERFPDRALTDEQVMMVRDWSKKGIETLIQQ